MPFEFLHRGIHNLEQLGAGDGTNLTLKQLFPSKDELERINNKYGAIEGAKQHLSNFGKYLAKLEKN